MPRTTLTQSRLFLSMLRGDKKIVLLQILSRSS
jgi:hypothetical protein